MKSKHSLPKYTTIKRDGSVIHGTGSLSQSAKKHLRPELLGKKSSNFNSNSSIVSLFALFVLILFALAFSHYIRTGNFIEFSFKSLLDYFAQMPDISVEFLSLDFTINGSWGAFDFLRQFFNLFGSILGIITSIIGLVGQALVVIFYLAGLFFI